jgi:uncharacterized membrane protein
VLTAEEFLSPEERTRVAAAITKAEGLTSAEIRVHLEDHIEEDVLDHAAFIFESLGMHRTQAHSGILIYVCVADRQMAVVGDSGINEKVPAGFWNEVIDTMRGHFSQMRHAQGLVEAVHMVGSLAGRFFPRGHDDRNELSNEVSFSTR